MYRLELRISSRFVHTFDVFSVFRGVMLLSLISLFACSKESTTVTEEFRTLPLSSTQVEVAIGENGQVVVDFDLTEPRTSLQLVSQSRGRNVKIKTLQGLDDRLLFDIERNFDAAITQADTFSKNLNVFNFPIIGEQRLAALSAGTYRATFITELLPASQYSGPVDETLLLTILAKNDDDITNGTVALKIFLSEVVGSSEEAKNALNNSLDVTREILSRAGLSLVFSIRPDSAIPETLPNPAQGASFYDRGSVQDGGYIPVYIATNVSGLNSELNSIAQAGNIPGPFIPSERTGIAVSLIKAGGSNTIIDSIDDREDLRHTSEVRLLGEALAHEILHYLGLQDTILFSGSTANGGDGIDSPKCISIEDCQFDAQAPQNIMFPFALERRGGGIDDPSEQDQNIPRQFFGTMQTMIAQHAIGTE